MRRHTLSLLATILVATPVSLAQQQTPPPSATGGQGQQPNQPAAGQPAAEVPQRPSLDEAYQNAGGSLYAAEYGASAAAPRTVAETSVFAVKPQEPKKIKKFDLITVIVREESQAKTKDSTDLKKSNDMNAILQQYFDLSLSQLALKGRATPENQPKLQYNLERNFKGEGTAERTDSMSARVTAQVIDVKPNGILVIQATKMIKNDEEEQKFVLTGMVRAEDVTIDNSVLSTQLADLMLEKTTQGAARDTSKRGWIPRLFDKLNPF